MSSNVYHVDQNVVFVLLEKANDNAKQQIRKINKEKLKIILQISGCKVSHSYKLCERIFDQIFSKLLQSFDKQRNEPSLQSQSNKSMNSATITEKYFKELVLNSVLEKAYIREKGEMYSEDFQIAWSLTERKQPLIIFLGGTSGTGKSTASSILASRFGISTVLSTDSIRHIMRNFITKEENPILFASTYEAGKCLTEEGLSENRRIIKGYKKQCEMVQERLEHVISAFDQKNDSIIIEGVHLTPFFMFKIMKKYKRVLAFSMCIKKESKHKERFAVRSKYMTLDSRNNKYVENFQNIRLIQQWFLEKYLIPKVDNVNIDRSIDTIHRTIIQYVKKMLSGPETDQNQLQTVIPIENDSYNQKDIQEYLKNKFNSKHDINDIQQSEKLKTEVNYIVEDQTENKDNKPLSDSEDQNEERRRRNQETEDAKTIKKAKSLKTLSKQDEIEADSPLKEIQEQSPSPQINNIHSQHKTHPSLKVAFQDIQQNHDETEDTPQKTDYKGLLHHLSKHKKIFLSKKTSAQVLRFIKKMIENYNRNYQSHDRIKLIQNQDGRHCLFKLSVHKGLRKGDSKEESSSEQDESERNYQNNKASFSERKDMSDGDSIQYKNESDDEELDNEINSVDGSISEEEQQNEFDIMKRFIDNEDEDSFEFELHKINEKDEFNDEIDEEAPIKLQVFQDSSLIQSP